MKSFFKTMLLSLCLLLTLQTAVGSEKVESDMDGKKVLVVYFSRTGENYTVGNITKGNTHIVADMIAAQTKGDSFEIVPATPYPSAYNDCIDIARKELQQKARPAVKGDVKVEDYDVIFIGYPIWWGDLPMAVYTFIEKHNWAGKSVIPFCTHEGSGLSGTDRKLSAACKGATIGKGLAIQGNTAQNNKPTAEKMVTSWLESLKL